MSPLWNSPPIVRGYVGTAVSRLRRPCLSLRLLLYKAISSRAEVAGATTGISASGLAAGPEHEKETEHQSEPVSASSCFTHQPTVRAAALR